MSNFSNSEGSVVIFRMIEAIGNHKQYLSDIDGAIGDGDHGINMFKGFSMAGEELEKDPGDLSHGLLTLAKVLMMRIGGSMGPLYGKIFKTMGRELEGHEYVDAGVFGHALVMVKQELATLTPARVGDKTLVDALYPAIDAFLEAVQKGMGFNKALASMKEAAGKGRDATVKMQAKLGRSSRLGERSVGVPDAGATSCALLLGVIADTLSGLIRN
jgi:dihydroxyacetone kinase-like protein